jgi:CBS domain containing-hemolysin-like protein
MEIDTGIPETARKEIAEGLSRLLADTYTLYLKTHGYRWNVTGWDVRQAWSAATSIDEICTVEADTTVDEVMERLRAEDQDRVLVVDGDSMLGIITPSDIMRWLGAPRSWASPSLLGKHV